MSSHGLMSDVLLNESPY